MNTIVLVVTMNSPAVDGDTWTGGLSCVKCYCERGDVSCVKECNLECSEGMVMLYNDIVESCCDCVPVNATEPTEKPCQYDRLAVAEDCSTCYKQNEEDDFFYKICAHKPSDCAEDERLTYQDDHCCECLPANETSTHVMTTKECKDNYVHGSPKCCSYLDECIINEAVSGSTSCNACKDPMVFDGSSCILVGECPCKDQDNVLRDPFDEWQDPYDPCILNVCYEGNTEATNTSNTCEVLSCLESQQETPDGECCAICGETTDRGDTDTTTARTRRPPVPTTASTTTVATSPTETTSISTTPGCYDELKSYVPNNVTTYTTSVTSEIADLTEIQITFASDIETFLRVRMTTDGQSYTDVTTRTSLPTGTFNDTITGEEMTGAQLDLFTNEVLKIAFNPALESVRGIEVIFAETVDVASLTLHGCNPGTVSTTTTSAPETTSVSTTPETTNRGDTDTTTARTRPTPESTPTTQSSTTTPYVCYDNITSANYPIGDSVTRPCERCMCVQNFGLMCTRTFCNLQPSDCEQGESVVNTDDGCCECRELTTTPGTTTPACLAPKIYRDNCDCQRTCEDMITPCTTPSPDAGCDFGCFCREGMVMASVNDTECVLEEECFPVCEFNNQTYQSGEKYQDVDDPCTEYTCLGEGFATSKYECRLPCEPSNFPPGCCTGCVTTPKGFEEKACVYLGTKYPVGTVIRLEMAIPCMVLLCQDDGVLIFKPEEYNCSVGCEAGVDYPSDCCDECKTVETTASPTTTETTNRGDTDTTTARTRRPPVPTTASTTSEGTTTTTSTTRPATTAAPTTTVTGEVCPDLCHVAYTCEDQWKSDGDMPWTVPFDCNSLFSPAFNPQCRCNQGYVKDNSNYVGARQQELGQYFNSDVCVKPLEGRCVFCEHNSIPYTPEGYYRENCEKCICTKNISSSEYYFECIPSEDPNCSIKTTVPTETSSHHSSPTPSTTPSKGTTTSAAPPTTAAPTTTVTGEVCPDLCHVTYTCEDQWQSGGDMPWTVPFDCNPLFSPAFNPQCRCNQGYVKDNSNYVGARQGELGQYFNSDVCVKPLEGRCVFCEHNSIPYTPEGYYRENCEKCTCTKNISSSEYYFDCVPSEDTNCSIRTTVPTVTSMHNWNASTTFGPTPSTTPSSATFLAIFPFQPFIMLIKNIETLQHLRQANKHAFTNNRGRDPNYTSQHH
eukprot:XP_011674219.1 PREDICTED: kielin/chordin-like protein [Strongylocentrotus purpuratus]